MIQSLNARNRFLLAVAILLSLMTGPFMLAAGTIWLDASPQNRELLRLLIAPHLPIGTVLTALGFFLGVAVIRYLFREYVGGLLRMAEHLRLQVDANRHFKIQAAGSPEVKALAEAANALAQQRNETMDSVQAQIEAANRRVEDEKNRLAALISELSQAVVVCNRQGRVLLYNQQARIQFHALSTGRHHALKAASTIGLGRSIYQFLDRQQIDHALEIIEYQLKIRAQSSQTSFVLSSGEQFLRVQMVPVLGAEKNASEADPLNGYVLCIENITRSFERETRRDQAFSDLVNTIQGQLVPMRMALQQLETHPESALEPWQSALDKVGHGIQQVNRCLDAGMVEFASMLKSRWPLDEILVTDVLAAAERRIEQGLGLAVSFDTHESDLWIRADSFHLVFALYFLAHQLQTACELRSVVFRQEADDDKVWFDLVWQAHMISSETVSTWELDAMTVEDERSPLSLREVLQRHGAEMRYERQKARHEGYFRLTFPKVSPTHTNQSPAARPEYYDFDLFHARDNADLLDAPLKSIAYTVFDTETTGLEPSKGDEIIQFGALRILNNRVLVQETFDQLVSPGFPLPSAGIAIHGITDAMLVGQPDIHLVLPVFHAFAADTVLIAHNAAFDMRFLQMKEGETGLRFGQPVLDTLLLSAVVQPNQTTHSLDAIAERLGIQVKARHNAMGDAWVTAEVFLKLIPLLADKGILTLRQALEASEKTYFARIKY